MKRFLALILTLILLLGLVPPVRAQSNFRNDEVSTLSKSETINKDYFATGEKVVLSGTVNGDAYLAGGNIIVEGVINGDLLVAGGNLNIRGVVTGDVRAAGGSIQIDGKVGGNITTLGGNVRIDDDAEIAGSMVVGAGNVEVFGPIGKGITAGAGSLMIANTVGSDVVAGVSELDIASNAVVSGELNYMSEKKAAIAEGASVSGQINHRVPPKDQHEANKKNFLAGAAIGWAVFKFFSSLAIGLVLLFGVPIFMQKVADAVVKNPLGSLGLGILFLILTPIVALLLTITLIGIPMAVILVVGYFFLIYIAKIFVSVAIGERILGMKANKIWSLVLGLAIFTVVSLVPVIGGFVEFAAILLGIGAALLTKKSMYSNLRTKKLI